MSKYSSMLAMVMLGCAGMAVAAEQGQSEVVALQEEVAPQAVRTAAEQALAQILAQQAEDLYPVADAVLNAGGTETDFYRVMKQAGNQGNPVAQLWLARKLLVSHQVEDETLATHAAAVQARALLKTAAEKGYVPAIVEMSRFAGSGIGAPVNEKEGMSYLMDACKQGSPRARAAYLLLSGRLDDGDLKNPAVASEINRKNFYLEEILANLLRQTDQLKPWLEKATAHGSMVAPLYLSQLLEETDAAKSLELLNLAAERHNPVALATLGSLKMNPPQGVNVQADEAGGLRMMQIAVMLDYLPAVAPLSMYYINHADKYSAERVFDLYNVATILHDPRSSVAYAYCLAYGRGCDAAPEQGVNMLEQLADAGSPYAYVALADLYYNGVGVKADMHKAISLLGEASASGVPNAYVIMAAITHMGNSVAKPDPNRAQLYLRMATEQDASQPLRPLFDKVVAAKAWSFLPKVK